MLGLLQSTVFVHVFLLALLLAWLAGSVAMAVSDAHETRRTTSRPAHDAPPPAILPAEASYPDPGRLH